jgi:hypothetical protein
MPPVAYFVLFVLFCIGSAAVLVSVDILRQGKLYHSLKPEARPRRWVLIWLLVLLTTFAVCFPVHLIWPNALISRVLLGLFVIVFAAVGLTLRNFSWLVDWYYKRKGWRLR